MTDHKIFYPISYLVNGFDTTQYLRFAPTQIKCTKWILPSYDGLLMFKNLDVTCQFYGIIILNYDETPLFYPVAFVRLFQSTFDLAIF